MDYLDFEVSVDARGDGEYEVSARAPSGEARTRVRFPFTPDQLAAQLRVVQHLMERTRGTRDVVPAEPSGSAEALRQGMQQFGRALFETLIAGKVLVAWRASGALAEKDGRGLRLQLRLQAPEMAALPWELMFDPDDASFVCLNPSTPLVRYPEIDRAPELLTVTLPLRVLCMIASPADLPQLDKAAERNRIDRALKKLRQQGLIELTWMEGATYRNLQAAMREGPWHILHFIGHGGFQSDGPAAEGVLALESSPSMAMTTAHTGEWPAGPAGPAHLVPADLVAQLLRGHPSMRLVLLNSCLGARASASDVFSSTASTLVRRGIPAVVAMQHEITDRAALVFAQAFYTSLAAGTPVERAVSDARAAISAGDRDSIEWGTPVLLMRSSSGVLFTPAATGPAATTTGARAVPAGAASLRRPLIRSLLALAPLAAAALLLAVVRAPDADIALDGEVTQVGVTLIEPRFAEQLTLRSLGVSGISAVELPKQGVIQADGLLLTALTESANPGQLTLDYDGQLPAGTRLTYATGDTAGSYRLTLGDSVPDLTVAAMGAVQVVVPGEMDQRLTFPTPAVLRLSPTPGSPVQLELEPDEEVPSLIAGPLPAEGLDLIRVDLFESTSGTELREVSAILSGQLALDGGEPQDLEPGEELRAGDVIGDITTLDLVGDHMKLAVDGSVSSLTSTRGGERRNLMPSLLSWLLAYHRMTFLFGILLCIATAALVLTRWRKTDA